MSETTVGAAPLHTLWSNAQAEMSGSGQIDTLLEILKKRFAVPTVMVSIAGKDGVVVRMFSGPDPTDFDTRELLAACAAGCPDTLIVENVALDLSLPQGEPKPGVLPVRFYAGTPLVLAPGGKPVGMLCLFDTSPKTLSAVDQALFKALGMAVSAMLVMPHNARAARAIALAAQSGVALLDHEQVITAINPKFAELTGFAVAELARMGLDALLCLDLPSKGALVLSNAILVDLPANALTRCRTHGGTTVPVEVFTLPLHGASGEASKTWLLVVPLIAGPIENFLMLLQDAERSELLTLHIAGLWAVDNKGRVLKLSGAPIEHLDAAAHAGLAGKTLLETGVFDALQTDWTCFYQSLSAGRLPAEMECCVNANGQTQWYSMRGFRQADNEGATVGYHGSFLDITQSKLREIALRKSEERLSLILKGSSDGAWDWDLETGNYYLSPRWWELMGRIPGQHVVNAEAWTDFIHPDDRKHVRETMQEAMAAGRTAYQAEFRMQHQLGHYIPVLGRGRTLFNESGKPVRASGTYVDLTPQRQAQSHIRLLESCVESLQDAVLITHGSPRKSPGPTIVYVNPAFERFTGYTRDEVIGKTPRLLQGPLTSRLELDKIADALARWQPCKVELANYKKDGTVFWVEIEITPVQTENSSRFTHWIGIQRDITARKKAEQALHITAQRLTMALDAAGLCMWSNNVARGEIFCDSRWNAMLGYALGSTPTKPLDWLKLVHPDDVQGLRGKASDALYTADATFEKEFRMRHQGGNWIWIQSRGKVTERNADGKPLVFAGTLVDITEEVEAKLRTERQNAQLSRCLEHLNVGVILQRQGIIKFVNTTLLTIFGAPRLEDIIGTSFSNYILPGDIAAAVARQGQLNSGQVVPSYWFNCVHLDGTVFKALTSSCVIEWEGEHHILSTMTPPGDIALLAKDLETTRNRYEVLLASQVEEEQTRIAQELHDSLGSQLAGIALHAATIKVQSETGQSMTQSLDDMLADITKAAVMTRDLARGLSPVDAWPGAFWRAMEQLCMDFARTGGVHCDFDMQGNFDDVPPETGKHLYRITQEAITNAVKHGGAKNITVALTTQADDMRLCIRDDGLGFDAPSQFARQSKGMGLSSMYARARTIGAQISLERMGSGGFCVLVTWKALG